MEVAMGEKAIKVIIIDDDPDFLRSTGTILKSAGYEVLEASSGKEGLEKSKAEKPDLYIIDLVMETYSEGSRLVEALKSDEETKDKPRIMITSVDLQGPWDAYKQYEQVGCDYVMQKPVSPAELLKYVEKAVSLKKD
jgi:CheY-like chemotaxis protein